MKSPLIKKKKKNNRKTIGLSLLLLIIGGIIIGFILLYKPVYSAPMDLPNELTLPSDLKINYNSSWVLSSDNLGTTFTNQDNTIIVVNTSKVSLDTNLDDLIKQRTGTLKNKDNVEVKLEDVNINGITFKHIFVNDNGDENFNSDERFEGYATLDKRIYTLVSIVYKKDANITEAKKIVYTLRN